MSDPLTGGFFGVLDINVLSLAGKVGLQIVAACPSCSCGICICAIIFAHIIPQTSLLFLEISFVTSGDGHKKVGSVMCNLQSYIS